jgi:type II secretory pathway component GspD/PulD (secretin)
VLTGCFSTQSLEDNPDLDQLITEILNHNKALEQKEEARLNKGITRLEVTQTSTGPVVSTELNQASIPGVIQRLFKEVSVSYVLEDVTLYGSVSARFNGMPLAEAVNRIVGGIGLTAKLRENLLVIKLGTEITGAGPDEVVYREVPVQNLSMNDAENLLNGIFPEDYAEQGRLVNFGTVPTSNSVYLYGTAADVGRAAQLLMKADRQTPHVAIEVLVVEFDQGAREEYDSQINNLIDDGGAVLNELLPGSVDFNWSDTEGLAKGGFNFKVTNLTSVVKMLVSDQKARLLSRPFISTLSGTKAEIKIVSERYVEVGDGDTTDVESGVTLKITPTVLADGKIRMEVSVEDSQFSGVNVSNILTEVNRNAAQTVMHVRDGQTIVVGGLMLDRRSWNNSGFPFLRHIPLLNLLTAAQESESIEKEVTIYITPSIWEPTYIEPLIGSESVGIDENVGIFRNSKPNNIGIDVEGGDKL